MSFPYGANQSLHQWAIKHIPSEDMRRISRQSKKNIFEQQYKMRETIHCLL